MSFSVLNSTVILSTSDTIITYSPETQSLKTLNLPKLQIEKEIKHHNKTDIDSFHGITSVSFSPNGEYFSVCTNRKQLCLYKTQDFSLISNRTLIRAASRVRFTPKNDLIVADKSGDVYLYSTHHPEDLGELILGHLSMLLDVLVTEDDRYIITADRDEKIRISHFKNSYNIESFCLGHSTFVSNISQLPDNKSLLISAGGDGEFKFWNYKDGKELKSVNFMVHIQDNYVKKLNENLKELELQEDVNNLPVKHLRLDIVGDKTILVASFYGSGVILVYQIFGILQVDYLQSISENYEPLECVLSNGKLWILFDWGIRVYKFEGTFVIDTEMNNLMGKLNDTWNELRSRVNKQMFYPILYKRKFDNVQEYQERKKSRLKLSN